MSNRNNVITRISKEQYEINKQIQKFLIELNKENVSFLKASQIAARLSKKSLDSFKTNLNSIKDKKRHNEDLFS